MFIPFYLIFLDPMVPMHPGASHAIDSIIGALSNPYAQPPLGYGFPHGGPTPPALFPLPVAHIHDMTCLLFFPNLLFTTLLPNLLIICIHNLVLHLLQH